MAKKALLDVLEQTIGKYVLNLDAESLNVAVWSGKIELNSLQLNVDACNAELDRQAAEAPNLALPFKVVSGSFGSFQVDVPWANLMSRPVALRAKGLNIAVEPYDRTRAADYLYLPVKSASKQAQWIEDQRGKSIAAKEEYRKQTRALRKLAEQELEPSKTKDKGSSSFGGRLVRRIIENIQVEITDVHVSLKGSESSAGVVLESLQLVTTDKDGRRTFVDRTSGNVGLENSFLYKALQIRGLGIYLDEEESKSLRLSPIREDDVDGLDHSYVLAPLTFEAKLRQADSSVCVEFPKYMLASDLNSLSILLSKSQVDMGCKIAEQIRPAVDVARPLFPEYRPLIPVCAGAAKEWWLYAKRCVGRLNGRRSWVEFLIAFQKRKKYIPLYKRREHHAAFSWLAPLTGKEASEIEALERDRSISVEGLMTWRNIADSQVEKEAEKRDIYKTTEKTSLFRSLFGSSSQAEAALEDEPPVSLSLEELRELETAALVDFADEVSKDSLLYDAKFVLGSFRINLTSYELRPLAKLQMGTASVAFDAKADGSYSFNFSLASLQITDKATPNSLFPQVLRNQQMDSQSNPLVEAFRVHLEKAKSGDLQLTVKLSTFEMVASPLLLTEMKRFVSFTRAKSRETDNPLLQQSLTGSVDLFYDAREGPSSIRGVTVDTGQALSEAEQLPSLATSPDMSNALVEAWKAKANGSLTWICDLDVQAPIVVVPENCVDPRANVLVFDLGHFRVQYGKIETASKVQSWFLQNPKNNGAGPPTVLDGGSLNISSLTFVIGKASQLRRLVRKYEHGEVSSDDEAVLEPTSLKLDFGVESCLNDEVPRICTFGIIPSIKLGLSPSQLSRILVVGKAWTKLRNDSALKKEDPVNQSLDDSKDDTSLNSQTRKEHMIERARLTTAIFSACQSEPDRPFPCFHADFRLQALSLSLNTDSGNGMEAHLVSVSATVSSFSDGSSLGGLSMGWFWILDRLENDFPRRQKLLAHSRLPLSSLEFAKGDKYDIMKKLEDRGVFDKDALPSSDLADITFRISGCIPFSYVDQEEEFLVDAIVDAKLTSLLINWNPRAVKTIMAMSLTFSEFSDSCGTTEKGPLIVASPGQSRRRSVSIEASLDAKQEAKQSGMTLVKAEMDSFDICLNSAKDDLPLFLLTMSRTRCSLLSSAEDGQKLCLVLGDIKISSESPEFSYGKTSSLYRTILGLKPGTSESLLSVQYCDGARSMRSLDIDEVDVSECEACAKVELSPMRMVYIHAQVLSLVEYATEGILGALAAQAASSAAAAAVEIVTSFGAKKYFSIQATGFDLLIPQAAYRARYISVHSGALLVGYTSYPAGGGQASLTLSDVKLQDTEGVKMQDKGVRMTIDVALPPIDVGSKEEQALRAGIDISEAAFIISKPQYAQLMSTLSENIGEVDLFLRDGGEGVGATAGSAPIETTREMTGSVMTHSGVAMVDNPRRIYMDVHVTALSLELCGEDTNDPIIRLTAVEAGIGIYMLPDQCKSTKVATLQDLVCDDRRLKAIGRQYRKIVYHEHVPTGGRKDAAQDAFNVSYTTTGEIASVIDLSIGSPRLVFIPDAIADALAFFTSEREVEDYMPKGSEHHSEAPKQQCNQRREVVRVEAVDSHAIEATIESQPYKLYSSSFTMKTSRCTVILVDLGSNILVSRSSLVQSSSASVAETIVLEGTFDAALSRETDTTTGTVLTLSAELNGDFFQLYTAFGHDLHSPLQVLDPAKFTLKVTTRQTPGNVSRVELRAALLTPLDVCMSMRNVALINAIVSGFTECFDDLKNDSKPKQELLSQQEAARLEELANALEREEPNSNVTSRELSAVSETSAVVNSDTEPAVSAFSIVSVKLTMPESKLTFINDLQGLDEALMRLTIRSFVTSAELRDGELLAEGSPPFKGFDFNVHTSFLAEYFDASANLWKDLLLKPWEITVKGARGASLRHRSIRPSTTVDVESFPCNMSFSEQFLMSLASANRMWSIYNAATTSALESTDVHSANESIKGDRIKQLRRSTAASAARTFISSLPYAVENHAGSDVEFLVHGERGERRSCPTGSIEYFRFEPPAGNGSGGKRLYGQDVTFEKSVSIYYSESCLRLDNLDFLLGAPRHAHELSKGTILVVNVVKEGKTVVVKISSIIDVRNQSFVSFLISVVKEGGVYDIGVCSQNSSRSFTGQEEVKSSLVVQDGRVSKLSNNFGVPVDMMEGFCKTWSSGDESVFSLSFSPEVAGLPDDWDLRGELQVNLSRAMFSGSENSIYNRFDVKCRATPRFRHAKNLVACTVEPFVLRASVSVILVDEKFPYIDILLEPRAVLVNMLPVSVSVRSPMPHTFSSSRCKRCKEQDVEHDLQLDSRMEIFTPGPSIAVTMKCSDIPMGGTSTEWLDCGWIDLPLVAEFRLLEPLRCLFPFSRKTLDPLSLSGARGTEFFVTEGSGLLPEQALDRSTVASGDQPTSDVPSIELTAAPDQDDWRKFYLTLYNYAVDHTGDILFEQTENADRSLRHSRSGVSEVRRSSRQVSPPFGAFGSKRHHGRVSLLPGCGVPVRLLHLTMEGDDGLKRSAPFCVEDVSICDGGVDATPLAWENGEPSGYFAYRKLVNSYQSELHVVPEFVVFNGSEKERVRVLQHRGPEMAIEPHGIAPLRTQSRDLAKIALFFPQFQGMTPFIPVDSLGLRMAFVKSPDGSPIASLAVQTVVGAQDSRLVIKLGEVMFGSTVKGPSQSPSILKSDHIRFRVQWSELQLTLSEARPVVGKDQAFFETALDRMKVAMSPERKASQEHTFESGAINQETWLEARGRRSNAEGDCSKEPLDAVCTILLYRFTVDWQRVFKDEDAPRTAREALMSNERSQLSVIIHNVQLKDETPNSPFPIVFSSTSQISFFDLCVRFRGPLDSDLVKVDLFDLNLAHVNGVSEKIIVNTSEDFVWKLLDLADRILSAAGKFAGVKIQLSWDAEHDGYIVTFCDNKDAFSDVSKYTPPRSDTLLNISKARVSPFTALVSFKRRPQAYRYKERSGMRGASIMNYFTRRLKFKIDKAELKFSRYEANNVKGPPDRLIELLSTVYLSRMKLKFVTIMTAASFQDWKYLASRDIGDDEFVEGDLLRVTGNLAGNTANYVLRKAGGGLGRGVGAVSNKLGDGIESAADAVGVRAVGAGVNSLVSGVGEGVGDALTGIGAGAGKALRGAGQGVGHVFGGVTGGALMVGKGIGKGIVKGDARAVVTGVGRGVTSVGTGLGQGVGSAVVGAADGVVSVGSGLFSGVRSVGRGIGGAFAECGCSCCCGCGDSDESTTSERTVDVTSPLLPANNTNC